MTTEAVTEMVRQALYVILETALPLLLVSMAIGLIVSIFQTVTSIQEQTLTFVPKLIGIFLTLMILGGWMMNTMVEYTTNLWTTFSYYVHRWLIILFHFMILNIFCWYLWEWACLSTSLLFSVWPIRRGMWECSSAYLSLICCTIPLPPHRRS